MGSSKSLLNTEAISILGKRSEIYLTDVAKLGGVISPGEAGEPVYLFQLTSGEDSHMRLSSHSLDLP